MTPECPAITGTHSVDGAIRRSKKDGRLRCQRRRSGCRSGRWRGGEAARGEDCEPAEGGSAYDSSDEELPPGSSLRGEWHMARNALNDPLYIMAKVRIGPHLACIEKGKRGNAGGKIFLTWHASVLYDQRNDRDPLLHSRLDLNTHEVVGVIEPPLPLDVFHGKPVAPYYNQHDLTRL